MDAMKRLPLILGLIFISVTVHRVALFSGGGFNGWAVALALAIGVFLSAYFTEMKTTSKPALVALVAFVLVDGLFNVSEVLKWSVEQGRWDFALKFSEQSSIYIYRFADPLYGIFPTLAAAMLGWLSKAAEKLIVNRKANWKDRLLNGVTDWLLGDAQPTAQNDAKPAPAPAQITAQKTNKTGKINRVSKRDWRKAAVTILRDNPDISGAQLGHKLGASARTGQNIISELEQAGIIHKNGNGWQVR
jgi:hypothetical protein